MTKTTPQEEQSQPRRRRRRGRTRPRKKNNNQQPVPLHKRSGSHFQQGDRQRGNDYFRDGRVQMEISGHRALAQIAGAEERVYHAGLDWSRVSAERVLHVFCECQRFANGRPCKHLWATLLAVADADPGSQPAGRDRLGIRKDRANQWPGLTAAGQSNGHQPEAGADSHVNSNAGRSVKGDNKSNGSQGGPNSSSHGPKGPNSSSHGPTGGKGRSKRKQRRRPSRGRGAPNTPQTTESPWKGQVDALRIQIDKERATLAKAENETPSSTSGLRVLINAAASQESGELIFDLFSGKTGRGQGGKMKRATLSPDELETLLMPPIDGGETDGGETHDSDAKGSSHKSIAVVTALPASAPSRQWRGRRNPQNPQQARVRRFRMPPELYGATMRRLAWNGQLGWWDGRNPNEGWPLTFEDEGPWDLSLRLELSGGSARLRGKLDRDEREVPVSKPVLILPSAELEELDIDFDDDVIDGRGLEDDEIHGADDHADLHLDVTNRDLDLTDTIGDDDDHAGIEDLDDFDEEVPTAPQSTLAWVMFPESIARLRITNPLELQWIDFLRDHEEITVPREELEEALSSFLELPGLPRLETPGDLEVVEISSDPTPRLVLEPDPILSDHLDPPLIAELSFTYDSLLVDAGDPRPAIVDWDEGHFLRRDMESEHAALIRLLELGLRPLASREGHDLELRPQDLPYVVEPLLLDGWAVEVHGSTLRAPSPPALRVQSGIDWFEVSGEVDFAGDPVELQAVLEAISRGDRFVKLGDGSRGLLPEEWLETYDSLAKLAQSSSDDGLRFHHSQALLVDALLAAMPPANVDKAFAELRHKLRSFERIKPKKESRGFKGELRGYQRQGLGWLAFLREFGLGGVLADDMGLGKTVQVLALIQAFRTATKTTGLPFLVVAPRSLVYNWIDEAGRFTPKLKVIEYGGPDREELQGKLDNYDMVVTTYGTLRRDIKFLATKEFDTAILDEAQAIKNPTSQTAKASNLLNAKHRLALTGTPIENHLGELGSIFEFLNPGLLGRLPKLDVLASGRQASREELKLVAEGIKPFILRRTKAEVLKDLPPKTEQVLLCTLHPEQQEIYDKLKATYQASLLKQVETEGVTGSTMQVLEALLRLRQVACHPGLVNPEWNDAGSAKLDALFEQVSEVLGEGHKVIVFSQFTKLLAYVREHLDDRGIEHAYLDGQTRNRGDVVERFQTDDDCNLFLISLKAGGVGLNLTAAEYVFLLDPWWNPAVEAQAIDRAHRIGQTQPVFAYRMIARGTVEEKILELQKSKRKIADAILGGEGVGLRDLTASDLRNLLS